MNSARIADVAAVLGVVGLLAAHGAAQNVDTRRLLTGSAAFASYQNVKPGVLRKITPADLPPPNATPAASNAPRLISRPADAWPQAPPNFKVDLYAQGLDQPRKILTAPNGDLLVAESREGRVTIFRGRGTDGKPQTTSVFAAGLQRPYGLAFYPPGANPEWLYVGNTGSIVRFPYKNGDLKATAAPQTLVSDLPAGGGHWTRDVAFSLDGRRLFVAVGSASNVSDPDTTPAEFHRAVILEYTPEGKFVRVYATGIRNAGGGLAVHPQTGELWCSVNERDNLGDNLVPDYITHVEQGGFYGWPWYYIGGNQDPRHPGKRPELKSKVIVPDVLLQPHNASLQLTFYQATAFPADYRGDIFAAQHGSWNKAMRAGYEVTRIPLEKGRATGEYEDFLTGFVTPRGEVWGRPVGVTTGSDGALYVTDDGSGSIWRVSYVGK